MLELLLTPKILGPLKIGGSRLKFFQPNGKSTPAFTKNYTTYAGFDRAARRCA